jgi:hypothetical protein
MSGKNDSDIGFGKFVPGFDFLQNLAKGASQAMPQMPNLSSWVAPTLNVDELEKRINDLKAVHFWLDQNAKALGATIQALEVQKMTLATLQGMNFNMGDVANALKLKTADTVLGAAQKTSEAAAGAAGKSQAARNKVQPKAADKKPDAKADAKAVASVVDPLQWWGALTQQFQQIATNAMKDAAAPAAMKSASPAARKRAAQSPAKRAAKKSSH